MRASRIIGRKRIGFNGRKPKPIGRIGVVGTMKETGLCGHQMIGLNGQMTRGVNMQSRLMRLSREPNDAEGPEEAQFREIGR